jgi:hypothetical protein
MTEFEQARDKCFEHAAMMTLCEWSEHTINLAPLPELIEAVKLIRRYDSGAPQAKQALQDLYDRVFKDQDSYGYTALGQVWYGIAESVQWTLGLCDEFGSWQGARFKEAVYLAAQAITIGRDSFEIDLRMGFPDEAWHAEDDWQNEVWHKYFDSYRLEFFGILEVRPETTQKQIEALVTDPVALSAIKAARERQHFTGTTFQIKTQEEAEEAWTISNSRRERRNQIAPSRTA